MALVSFDMEMRMELPYCVWTMYGALLSWIVRLRGGVSGDYFSESCSFHHHCSIPSFSFLTRSPVCLAATMAASRLIRLLFGVSVSFLVWCHRLLGAIYPICMNVLLLRLFCKCFQAPPPRGKGLTDTNDIDVCCLFRLVLPAGACPHPASYVNHHRRVGDRVCVRAQMREHSLW